MTGGSKEPQTQTTQYVLSPEQRELYNIAMPGVRQFAADTPERYQGSKVAGFDPSQVAAQNQLLGATGAQQDLANNAVGANNYLLSNLWDPNTNVNLAGAVNAATRPITEQLTEKALPAIRGQAINAGGGYTGSSRQGIAEAGAIRDAGRNVGDTASKVVNENYQANLNAQLRALGLAPTTQQVAAQPALTTGAVGDVRQGLAQALINQDVSNFTWDRYAPFLQSQEIIGLANGLQGGSNVSTASTPQKNTAMSALGGAASGAALGSTFGPWGTAIGGGAGLLMGLFG